MRLFSSVGGTCLRVISRCGRFGFKELMQKVCLAMRNMSLVPIACCTECGRFVPLSVACTECANCCCGPCFGLPGNSELRLFAYSECRVCVACRISVGQVKKSKDEMEELAVEGNIQVKLEASSDQQIGKSQFGECSVQENPDGDAEKSCVTQPNDSLNVSESGKDREPEEVPEKRDVFPEPVEGIPNLENKDSEKPDSVESIDIQTVLQEPRFQMFNFELCDLHSKELRLFCLNCEQRICSDCFLVGSSHMRHQIDLVETVYRERRSETENKLAALENSVVGLQDEVLQSEKNLEILQDAEQAILDEVEAICSGAKQSVEKMTADRKRKLLEKMDLPAKKRKLNLELQGMINQLVPDEFFRKQHLVNRQCDEIIESCAVPTFTPMEFEDIGCELVPSYQMQTYTLAGFDKPVCGWPQHITTAYDVQWNVFLRKKQSLFVKVVPNEGDQHFTYYPYKLLVLIPHPDIRKTITRTFTLKGDIKEESIVTSDFLEANGFLDNGNELVIKIGLRPLNAITENRFLKQQNRDMKARLEVLEKKLLVTDCYFNCKFYIMQFNLNLAKAPKRNTEAHHSAILMDRLDRHWVLRVYPFDVTVPDTNLKVFIVLRKGSRTKCRYFIELFHDDPNQNVMQTTESSFDTLDAGYGWHCFMDRKRLLSDAGYYPNGVLRFRFGVQPLD
ncbi:uncharacterized protein LOC129759757 [Uranotaenia lowii]|uniref:uncharacterized protein LOC129759757 n=1 Tax=Uranotaenia lowii TaxID=190385 RepID=UPI002478BD7D|nr:uncharacterized protein LOC129759757 [Uranotaenia lowii]